MAYLKPLVALLAAGLVVACGGDDDDATLAHAGQSGTGGGALGGGGGAAPGGRGGAAGGSGAPTAGRGGRGSAGDAGSGAGAQAGHGGGTGAAGGSVSGGAAGSGQGGAGRAGGGTGGSAGAGRGGRDNSGGMAGEIGTDPAACDTLCEYEASCTSGTNCPTDCESRAASLPACADAGASFAECIRSFGPDCPDIETSCSMERSRQEAACDLTSGEGDSCRFANDDTCDEPGFCEPGTDTTDCAGANSCPLAYNDTCDEGAECAFGTDTADCN